MVLKLHNKSKKTIVFERESIRLTGALMIKLAVERKEKTKQTKNKANELTTPQINSTKLIPPEDEFSKLTDQRMSHASFYYIEVSLLLNLTEGS